MLGPRIRLYYSYGARYVSTLLIKAIAAYVSWVILKILGNRDLRIKREHLEN